ncbi:HIRAN domain-containing protein [Sphingomonas cannabina]|uniref:HIRAN domain-containing protein n=1 Tax=Sphingomonas cannabina TaxID=2899123 RepID=UPI001F3937EB|nr:HIRAN domain-containing protein [Sphingomonas cannabina]UIJ43741.1 HIRAN domain-containing protein [Sphingomonas cannabina]
MADELTLAVVGIDYANADGSNRRFEIGLCRPGDPIELRPEPTNEHDELAVAVWRPGGGQMGYVTAERAPFVRQRLATGYKAVFQGVAGSAAYIRARFGGGDPTLPPAPAEQIAHAPPRRSSYDPDAFYPDPDGPEWGA